MVGVGFVVGVGVVSLVLSLLVALLLVGSKGRSPRAHGVHARRLAYMCTPLPLNVYRGEGALPKRASSSGTV